MFDRYVIVDWSASNSPKTGKDSIWICDLSSAGEFITSNPPTRGKAESAIRNLLHRAASLGERVLVCFDFPYGYPSGFAAALKLSGPPWRAIWDYLAAEIRDDEDTNRSNRFDVASAINGRLSHHTFWGRPATQLLDHLSMRRDQARYRIQGESTGLSEWREVERVLRGRGIYPHSVWKLLGAGSVGSQALTGIPVVSRLRGDPQLSPISKAWPFEVGAPDLPVGQAAIIHAEVWPSLRSTLQLGDQVRDEAQVIGLARELRAKDRAGTLTSLFTAAGTASSEEGWILGVT
jgi:hypothetical protein